MKSKFKLLNENELLKIDGGKSECEFIARAILKGFKKIFG